MKRSNRRRLALWKSRLARVLDSAKRALTTDADVTVDTAPAERAEAETLLREAAALRGGVAKLGQLRAYFDPTAPDARARLAELWDRMPADPPARIRRVIVEQLGQEPEALFARWDDAPLAAASLGQVHAAEDAGGRRLAVKVQYPEVAAALEDDLSSRSLLRRMVGADLGEAVDEAALAELRARLLDELDYRKEGANLERFRRLWLNDPAIVIPTYFTDRSVKYVLTMERLEGTPLPELSARGDEAARSQVAATIFRFAFGSPLRHGLFNADPHPGNYLVLDAALGRVGFVDFGGVAELGEEVLAAERQLWRSLVVRDGEALRHAAHLEGLVTRAEVFESGTWREWERALAAPFLARGPVVLEPAAVRRLVALTSELLRARHVALPAPVLLLWRQRLGVLTVLASLRPRLDFRRLLAALVDDGRHPIPLADRYR
jgi:predicted unusual protein kinase regulating ubiquinone biosynthesis (AarF/ABC1/UbiB family)